MAQVIKNSSIKNNQHLFGKKKKKEIYLFLHCISCSLLDYLSLKSHSGGVIPNPIKRLLCWMRISILFDSACFPRSVVLFCFQLRISVLVCFKFRLSVCLNKGNLPSATVCNKFRISAQIHVCNLVCVTVSTLS